MCGTVGNTCSPYKAFTAHLAVQSMCAALVKHIVLLCRADQALTRRFWVTCVIESCWFSSCTCMRQTAFKLPKPAACHSADYNCRNAAGSFVL
jgi:hypothetical protein